MQSSIHCCGPSALLFKAQHTPAGHNHGERVCAEGVDVDVNLVDESRGAGEVSFEAGNADKLTLQDYQVC